ncbi:hypothetical protein [Amycolatopsis sp. WAC 01416]|uniref:hypothetical protein n=1 Tax=Amycolatopsis sp. WAC 01416 TaxID=2203196 RepID=UPI0018F7B8B1|nr:hypothetical protein [Amycolatopsis sp. WAC 01416]
MFAVLRDQMAGDDRGELVVIGVLDTHCRHLRRNAGGNSRSPLLLMMMIGKAWRAIRPSRTTAVRCGAAVCTVTSGCRLRTRASSSIEVRLRAEITKLKKTIANKNEKLAQLEADGPALVRTVHDLTLENHEQREQQPTNVVAFRPRPVEENR